MYLDDREVTDNIDRPNLELMSHFEGPIVDSFYEIALQSWYNKLSPPLPFIATPYQPPKDEDGNIRYLFADQNPYFDDIEVVKAAKAARELLKEQTKDTDLEKERDAGLERQTFTEAVRRVIEQQRASFATWAPGEQLDMKAQQAMRDLRELRDKWSWNPSSRAGSRANSRGPSRRTSLGEIPRSESKLYLRTLSLRFTMTFVLILASQRDITRGISRRQSWSRTIRSSLIAHHGSLGPTTIENVPRPRKTSCGIYRS